MSTKCQPISPRQNVVVIGNGMVGQRFCERLVELDVELRFRIITFCEESRAAYDRVGLTSFFAHRDAEKLMLARQEWYAEKGIELHTGDRDQHVPSVFIVDDDTPLLESLVAMLEALGFQARGFSCPASFLRYYRAEMPGCLILDIQMPRQNGLELYEQLLREGKRLPVIFITAHADVMTAVAAMKTGAIEFIEKPFDRKMLIDFTHKALKLDSQWRARDSQIAALENRVARLSDREMETLRLIQAGESNKSMAAKLLLTERAVEMRRSTIMRKLQVQSVAELLDLTITHRILTDLRQAADQSGIARCPSAEYLR